MAAESFFRARRTATWAPVLLLSAVSTLTLGCVRIRSYPRDEPVRYVDSQTGREVPRALVLTEKGIAWNHLRGEWKKGVRKGSLKDAFVQSSGKRFGQWGGGVQVFIPFPGYPYILWGMGCGYYKNFLTVIPGYESMSPPPLQGVVPLTPLPTKADALAEIDAAMQQLTQPRVTLYSYSIYSGKTSPERCLSNGLSKSERETALAFLAEEKRRIQDTPAENWDVKGQAAPITLTVPTFRWASAAASAGADAGNP